jgi:MinD-like ATPase involved in chromosome partitioning or flagellar assembly
MRILTVSSGKGGVGKTTFAINFALDLSRYGKTMLIDLDTCTSSIRNSIDIPINKDLYHFFRKGHPLEQCVTTLDKRLDPKNRYANFGFVAGTRHIIEEITNLDKDKRNRLIDAINGLNVKYVVLDLKAGLDHNVLDFLPYSNTGILIFTPHLPAATMAASDVVKALLLRKLRSIFAKSSPVFFESGLGKQFYMEINNLIDLVEDVYDDQFVNLDSFLVRLKQTLGNHRLVQLIVNTVEYFRAYFVLNMFNETRESYEKAVKPFVENIVENVSSRISINNIGCIINSPKIQEANSRRIPLLLFDEVINGKKPLPALEQLADWCKGLEREKREKSSIPDQYRKPDPKIQLRHQLDILRTIHTQTKDVTIEQNFNFISERTQYLLGSRRSSDFGDTHLFKEGEILAALFQRGR